jgi:hypothetical protein
MLSKTPQVTPEHIANLEILIQQEVSNRKKRASIASSNDSGTSGQACSQPPLPNVPSSGQGPILPPGCEWEAITILQAIKAKDERDELAKQKLLKQQQLASLLHTQVAEGEVRLRRDREGDREYSVQVARDVERYKAERSAVLTKQQEIAMQNRRIWDQQVIPTICTCSLTFLSRLKQPSSECVSFRYFFIPCVDWVLLLLLL